MSLIKKRTKIVATISDKKCEPEFLKDLYDAGMDVVRINSAHCSIEGALKIIKNVRKVSEKIAILIDTKGPEIRTTACDSPILLMKGTRIKIVGDPDKKTTENTIHVTYPKIASEVPIDATILMDDGEVKLTVVNKSAGYLECLVENDAELGSKKSVNVPAAKINLPSLTEKDKIFIEFAAKNGVDFIAHSFVRSKQDVIDVKEQFKVHNSDLKIISKVENEEGVENLDEILEESYGLMVARGDLAIEVPYERIPGLQKMMINKCIISRKPVIVATQMLHSMINSPRPTRAEVSDVANAIYSQTDAVMLSGETASGKFPVEAVKAMTRIALEAEKTKEKFLDIPYMNVTGEISAYLAKVAVKTAYRIGAKGVIADTEAGRTIRDMASYRGINLILAQCYSKRTMRELALSYGVYASHQEKKRSVDDFIHIALKNLKDTHDMKDEDVIVVLAGNFSDGSGFSFIEVGTVQYLKDRVDLVEK